MNHTLRVLAACFAALILAFSPAIAADPAELFDQGVQAAREERWEEARSIFERVIEAQPRNAQAHYNLACALAQQELPDHALSSLETAIAWGFSDFHHMAGDPDLEPVHDDRRFRVILAGWRELLDARAEADMEAVREAFGKGYAFERDEALRLQYASAFEPDSFEQARAEIERVASWARQHLFPVAAQQDTPDPWVTVILPKQEHFRSFVGGHSVGGIYDHSRRILAVQDIGPSLRHEFLHALHYRHMMRLRQDHPIWVEEGLAALVEDLEPDGEGSYRPALSWRTNTARRLAKGNRLTDWERLFTMEQDDFANRRPLANYAQARAVFMFLFERGALADWLAAYASSFDQDASGLVAIQETLSMDLRTAQREFRAWLLSKPEVAETIEEGEASLGVVVGQGEGDGPVVEEVVVWRSGAEYRERLVIRDVITAIDGVPTRTLEELIRALSSREVGDIVRVSVRRASLRLEIPVELVGKR